jgi:hypothetical protein
VLVGQPAGRQRQEHDLSLIEPIAVRCAGDKIGLASPKQF